MKTNGHTNGHGFKLQGLTRKQELTLIQIGLQTVINQTIAAVATPPRENSKGPRAGHNLTPAGRRALAASMKRRWKAAKREGTTLMAKGRKGGRMSDEERRRRDAARKAAARAEAGKV